MPRNPDLETENNTVEKQFDLLFSHPNSCQYDFNPNKMGRKDRQIIKFLADIGIRGKNCLDVGPGTGRWITYLKQNQADYLAAIDISQASLDRCSPMCSRVQKANLEKDGFIFDDQFFDLIISFEVIEHLVAPDVYLSEMMRVLKPDGVLLMSTPNLVSLMSRIRMLFGMVPTAIASDNTHVRFYRQKEIKKLLGRYHLSVEFFPTSICLNPSRPKSKFSIPSFSAISGLDDNLLFKACIAK